MPAIMVNRRGFGQRISGGALRRGSSQVDIFRVMRRPRWFQDPSAQEREPPSLPGADGWAATATARLSSAEWLRLAGLDLGADYGSRPWQNPEWRDRVEAGLGDRRTAAVIPQRGAASPGPAGRCPADRGRDPGPADRAGCRRRPGTAADSPLRSPDVLRGVAPSPAADAIGNRAPTVWHRAMLLDRAVDVVFD
jgi:hypothetical protein